MDGIPGKTQNVVSAGGGTVPVSSVFRNLDMLRAIAVLCVFFAHLCLIALEFGYLPVPTHVEIWKILLTQLGRVGVLFFFVHTALVLMLSLDRTQPVGLIVNFYIRRIFRVYPLCIVCILAVLVLK